MISRYIRLVIVGALLMASGYVGQAQDLPADIRSKADAEIARLKSWSTDPEIVHAVESYNRASSAEAKSMTNAKWKSLSILDPFVRSLSKNDLAAHLKAKKDDAMVEIFVSGADGGKVAFLSKTTSWSHKGQPKHEVPMSGKTYIGPIDVDESSGQRQFQVGLPVLAEGKPIGSIVVGLRVANLK